MPRALKQGRKALLVSEGVAGGRVSSPANTRTKTGTILRGGAFDWDGERVPAKRRRGKTSRVVHKAKALESAKTPEEELEVLLADHRAVWASDRCKVCASPYRTDVETWRGQGDSVATIAEKLGNRGVAISGESVRRHLKNHVNVAEIVLEKAAKDRERIRQTVDSETTDLDRLDALIKALSRVVKNLTDVVEKAAVDGKQLSMSVANAYQTVTSELRQAIQLRQRLTAGQPADDVDKLLAHLWTATDGEVPQTPVQRRSVAPAMVTETVDREAKAAEV